MQHLLTNASANITSENPRGHSNSTAHNVNASTRELSGKLFKITFTVVIVDRRILAYGLYYMEDPEVAASAIMSTLEGLRSSNEITNFI